jgi:S-adenosylmethionine:tRNA ribosyltransferase-isomerase
MRAVDTVEPRASGRAGANPVVPPPAAAPVPARAAAPATGVTPPGPAARTRAPRVTSLRSFRIPEGAEAGTPVELSEHGDGRLGSDARADVRLMVARGGGAADGTGTVEHHRFADLPGVLDAGDVLVVNTSAVVPAALDAWAFDGSPLRLHLSTEQPGGFWVVEPRLPAGPGTERFHGRPPAHLDVAGGGCAELLAPYPAVPGRGIDGRGDPAAHSPAGMTPSHGHRLWLARLDLPAPVLDHLAAHGQPIRYAHAEGAWPVDAYQSVFARVPGSAEMPSAARPFTHALVTDLVSQGVAVAPIVLHTGVSSQEAGEPPYAERYDVPASTAALVTAARADGRRVIAVGTTVVRALETTADDRGRSHPGRGWTELVVTPERGVYVVDGLLTGWHEPESSHLAMLEAVAGRGLLAASYDAAVAEGYRWHEFGDSHLILPGNRPGP